MTRPIIINQRNPWIWINVGIAIISIFLIFRGCQVARNESARNTILQHQLDSTILATDAMTGRFIEDRKTYDARINSLTDQTNEQKHKVDSLKSLVIGSENKAARYATQLRYAREALIGDDSISVSPLYVLYCDSLGDLIPTLNAQIDAQREEDRKKDSLLFASFDAHINELNKERKRTDSALGMASLFRTLAQKAVKDAAPRTKLYIVASGVSDVTRYGILAGLTLTSKGGNLWSGKIGLMNGRAMYELEFGRLLSLRKK